MAALDADRANPDLSAAWKEDADTRKRVHLKILEARF